MTDDPIACRDACGAKVADQEAALQAGWSWLSIIGAWRCGDCEGALMRASRIEGARPDPVFIDQIPPASIGALRKETASTIKAPSVKANPA